MEVNNKQLTKLKLNSTKLEGNCGGVYFLFNHEELVYIGKGWNCLLRIAEHTRKDSDKVFTSWNYISIDEADMRSKVERTLIKTYKPLYNKVYNR